MGDKPSITEWIIAIASLLTAIATILEVVLK